MWFFLSLLSAILYAWRSIIEKHIIKGKNKYVLGFAIRFFALPFFLIPFILHPESIISPLDLNLEFWMTVVLVGFLLTPLETIFYYEALKEEEVSLVLPILNTYPIVTLVFSIIILHQIPNIYGFIGVVLMIFGVYALKLTHAREGLLGPFHHLRNNRGVRLMSIVLLSYGFGAVIDKIGINNSNAYVYGFVNYLFVSISLFIVAMIKARHAMKELWIYKKIFFIIGLVVASYTITYMIALEDGFTFYVMAIRSSSIIFTIILSYIFFKEKNIKSKLVAGFFIIVGLLCIKILG